MAIWIEWWLHMLDAAIDAEEMFGVDECERYAEELRHAKG